MKKIFHTVLCINTAYEKESNVNNYGWTWSSTKL